MIQPHEMPLPNSAAEDFEAQSAALIELLSNNFGRLAQHIREHSRHNEKIDRARDLLVTVRSLTDEAAKLLGILDDQADLVRRLMERAQDLAAAVKVLADENVLHPASTVLRPVSDSEST